MYGFTTKQCMQCKEYKHKDYFSNRQWRKPNERRCNNCINTIESYSYLYAHEDGHWRECVVEYEAEEILILKYANPKYGEKPITVTNKNIYRCKYNTEELVNTKHELLSQILEEQKKQNINKPDNELLNEQSNSENDNDKEKDHKESELETDKNKPKSNTTNSEDTLLNNAKVYTKILATIKLKYPELSQQEIATFVTMEYKKRISETNYTQMIWQDKNIQSFKTKYPTNQNEFWLFLTAMNRFKNENVGIDEERLLQKIILSLKILRRDDWNEYQSDKVLETCRNKGYNAQETLQQTPKIRKSLNTFKEFESYLMDRLRITPSYQYFAQQLSYIRMGYDENPEDTHRRIVSYLYQMKTAITKFNANKTNQYHIRHITDQEQKELYERVFVWNNHSKEYKNDGKLNRKVKLSLSKYWQENRSTMTMKTIINKIKDIHITILPNDMRTSAEGEHWKKFKATCTIFQLKPISKLTGKKRARDENNDEKENKPKRQKTDISHVNMTKRCKYQFRCRNIVNGKCKYRHTAYEMRKASKAKDQAPQNPNPTPTGRQHGGPAGKPKPKNFNRLCKYKDKCRDFKKGTCRYQHKIQCPICRKYGHKEADCWFKNKKPNVPNTPTQYNPFQNPNPHKPTPHKLLPLKIGDQYYQTQTIQELIPMDNPSTDIKPLPELETDQNAIFNYSSLALHQKEQRRKLKTLKREHDTILAELKTMSSNPKAFTTPRK